MTQILSSGGIWH